MLKTSPSLLSAPLEPPSISAPSPLHRLPVNPRRKKVAPDERKRVATATEFEQLQRRCMRLEDQVAAREQGHCKGDAWQLNPPSRSSLADTSETISLNDDTCHTIIQTVGSDGRLLADHAGEKRFHGGTSGATFLDTLKELIQTATPLARVLDGKVGEPSPGAAFLGSLGQYQTHDSRPMDFPPGLDPLALPSEPEIAAALFQTRHFLQDGNMAYRSGGIWFWPFHDARTILSIASTPGVPGPDGRTLPGAHHQPLVLHHTAFAVAHLLNLRSPGSAVEGQLGEHFIARAQSLMGNLLERTSHTIEDIAGYALYGLYLLENNRRDAAYRYISNAMILSMSQGFHRELIILAVRPAMLMAVHKAVASIFCTPQPFDLDAHQTTSPIDRIRDCSDAARCNLRLGRLMRLRSPRQKLLLPDLHNIFNAAIVLTMHQIIFVNLRTQDVDDVVWATQVFEDEAGTGSEYGRDCALVLRDLTYIASQLRNPIHNPDTKQDVQLQQRVFHDLLPEQETGLGMKVEHGEEYPTPALCLAESSGHGEQRVRYQSFNDIYKTLSGWWKEDPMQLYETFLS
ncbi:hypothetical protein N0V88_007325 [Collariella sp. IMI 366227]|nr:hypothetical protein N0V88_007325 [Collariella sp. IMI 366227]